MRNIFTSRFKTTPALFYVIVMYLGKHTNLIFNLYFLSKMLILIQSNEQFF